MHSSYFSISEQYTGIGIVMTAFNLLPLVHVIPLNCANCCHTYISTHVLMVCVSIELAPPSTAADHTHSNGTLLPPRDDHTHDHHSDDEVGMEMPIKQTRSRSLPPPLIHHSPPHSPSDGPIESNLDHSPQAYRRYRPQVRRCCYGNIGGHYIILASYPGLPSQLFFPRLRKKSCEGRPGYEANIIPLDHDTAAWNPHFQ